MSEASSARSPLTVVFLLHVALEAPLAVQGLWSPTSLPFIQMNNSTLVFLKLYSSLMLGTCLTSILCFSLPDFFPGKRGFAIGLCLYHSICSTVLFQAPRFVPHTFGAFFEGYKIYPETVWGTMHGFLSLALVMWWQATVHYAAMARKGK